MAYNDILDKTRQEMEILVSNGLNSQKYTKLFTAMHQLRMLCVQGVSSAGPSAGTPYLLPIAAAALPSVDLSFEICSPDESLDLIKAGSAFCPNCGRLFSNPKGSPRSVSPQSPHPNLFQSCMMAGYSCNVGVSGMKMSTKLKALVENLTHV
jgi:hypothetical protein